MQAAHPADVRILSAGFWVIEASDLGIFVYIQKREIVGTMYDGAKLCVQRCVLL